MIRARLVKSAPVLRSSERFPPWTQSQTITAALPATNAQIRADVASLRRSRGRARADRRGDSRA